MQATFSISSARRIVVKLGTRVLTEASGKLDTARIAHLCEELAALRQAGRQVIVVSSGAVGLGMDRLGLKRKPSRLATKQTCAAVGQSILTETWQNGFAPHGLTVAQVLLTRDDVRSRRRHVAVKDLLEHLLNEGIVPIINENDAISADELKFGDNDVLSALVASLTKAELLAILSTAPGLINPANGQILPLVEHLSSEIRAMAGGAGDATSTGGMITKLDAAEIATLSGCGVFIGSGAQPQPLSRLILKGEAITGTVFPPREGDLNSRRRWLAFFEKAQGQLTVDAGAVRALRERGSSLLAKGCRALEGDFEAGAIIAVQAPDGTEIARGSTPYSSVQLQQILGCSTSEIVRRLPALSDHPAVIHRDNLILM